MAPPAAKRSRPRGSQYGVLRIECTNVSTNVQGWGSGEVEVGGRMWSATVFRKEFEGKENLCCDLGCDDNSTINVDVEYVAIGERGNDPIKKSVFFLNGCDDTNMGHFFLEPKYLLDEGFGVVRDNKMIVEIRIAVNEQETTESTDNSIDFTNETDPRHDVTFVIRGEKIYAGKQILSLYSPVFTAMFYGELRSDNDIVLEDIDRDEFLHFLRFIYPSTRKITAANARSLLKLADRYLVKLVTDLAEDYYITSTDNFATKLHFSEKYRLDKLKNHCFSTMMVSDIKIVKESLLYFEMSDTMKIALFEKLTDLVN